MKKSWICWGIISIIFLFGSFFFFCGSLISLLSGGARSSGDIAIVEIIGGIFDAKPIVESLSDLKEDKKVKGVVLRIDSPGGGVGASQEIYEAVKDFKKDSGKPVVVSMGSVAASGGYYVAVAADKIVANRGTITGSIGVIMEWMNFEDLLQWAKLKPLTLKSGRLKDVGSPTREMTQEEKDYLEEILKRMHQQFKKAVAEGRKLSNEEVESLADGRVFTGEEAQEKKLVDEIGSLNRAVHIAADMAGIKGEPESFYPQSKKQGFFERLAENMTEKLGYILINAIRERVNFSYRGL